MLLHEILVEAARRLGDIGCAHVSISRPSSTSTRVWRFEPISPTMYSLSFRYVVPDGAPPGTPRFPDAGGRQWSSWISVDEHPHFGFSPEDVLATDWKFAE